MASTIGPIAARSIRATSNDAARRQNRVPKPFRVRPSGRLRPSSRAMVRGAILPTINTECCAVAYPAHRAVPGDNASPGFQPLARDIERERGRVGDIEALDLPGEIEPRDAIAGGARQLPQSLAFRAEDERKRRSHRHLAEIGFAGAVEPHEQVAPLLERRERA